MISAYSSAFRQLDDPPVRRVVYQVALWAALFYVVVGVALWTMITSFDPSASFAWIPIDWLEAAVVWIVDAVVSVLGFFVFMALLWLLFVPFVQLVSGFHLERVIAAVEARHYPGRPPARQVRVMEAMISTARLFGAIVLFNLLALPLYLIPLVGVVVFLLINGYLLGREYFEQVAQRRLDDASMRRLRRTQRGTVLGAGVIATVMLSIPLVNLVAPIVGVAAMVHLFEAMPGGPAAAGVVVSPGA